MASRERPPGRLLLDLDLNLAPLGCTERAPPPGHTERAPTPVHAGWVHPGRNGAASPATKPCLQTPAHGWLSTRAEPLEAGQGRHHGTGPPAVKPGLGGLPEAVGVALTRKGLVGRQRWHRAASEESSSRPCAHPGPPQSNPCSHCTCNNSACNRACGTGPFGTCDREHERACEGNSGHAARGVSCGSVTPCCSDVDVPPRPEASSSPILTPSPTPTPTATPSPTPLLSVVNTALVSDPTSLMPHTLSPGLSMPGLLPGSSVPGFPPQGPSVPGGPPGPSLTRVPLPTGQEPAYGALSFQAQAPACPAAAARVLASNRRALLAELLRLKAEEVVLTAGLGPGARSQGAPTGGARGSPEPPSLKRKRRGDEAMKGDQRMRPGEGGSALGTATAPAQKRQQHSPVPVTPAVHPAQAAQAAQRRGLEQARLANESGSMQPMGPGAGWRDVASRARLAAAALRLCAESPRLPLLSRVQRQQLLVLVGGIVKVVENCPALQAQHAP